MGGHECPTCNLSFVTRYNLQRHFRVTHAKVHKYSCVICGNKFPYKYSLSAHMIKEHGEPRHTCQQCQKEFNSRGNLTQHLKSCQVVEKHFRCATCAKSFKTGDSLRQHNKYKHRADLPEKQCQYCGRIFVRSYDLSRHVKRVHKDDA